ncbi:MAG: hypothetical protein IH586_03295 [Anaerolineaceae bacterium]|nr:hypothetical protein [Anaerolineaceae bacterium]
MYMILCVIDQPDQLGHLLKAWQENGISGVTILESTGMHRLSEQPRIPMRYAFNVPNSERGNITLIMVVEKEETIQHCLEITEGIIGDFNGPNTGIFISWPLGFAKGVVGKQSH